jgi:hypothetical protein
MQEERLVAATVSGHDAEVERSLRPRALADFPARTA